jgi:hypothetical protein
MWHAWERKEKCTRFWWGNPKKRHHLEDRDEMGGWDQNAPLGDFLGVWTELKWLRIGAGGGLL